MKQIKIKVIFTDDGAHIGGTGTKILKSFKSVGVEITSMRYTYVESKHGVAKMPPALILAGFLSDFRDCRSLNHILPTLSGEYEFVFEP